MTHTRRRKIFSVPINYLGRHVTTNEYGAGLQPVERTRKTIRSALVECHTTGITSDIGETKQYTIRI